MDLVEFKVNFAPSVITTNFEETQAHLAQIVKHYEIEVTQENIKEAHGLAAELNQLSKRIESNIKEYVKKSEVPIDILKEQGRVLTGICQNGRAKITDQIKVYQDKSRGICLQLLQEELAAQYKTLNIEQEFQTIKVDDLALLTNLTESEKLTKGAKEAILTRVNEVQNLQSMVKLRLVKLEHKSLKAGLKSAVNRSHIENFIKAEEAEYNHKLDILFQLEIRRQAEIEAKIRIENEKRILEEEARLKQADSLPSAPIVVTPAINTESLLVKSAPQAISSAITQSQVTPPKTENDCFIITATFKMEVKSGIATAELIKQKFAEKLISSGITTTQSINVEKLI